MARSHPLSRLLLAILLFAPTLAIAEPSEDPITATVSQAEQTFCLSVVTAKNELATQIKAVMERETQRAVDIGDLDALEILQAQLKAYETDGTLPDVPATRSHTQNYQKKLTRLGDNLIKAYETATRRYTQARDIDNARLMKDKINWTRPTAEFDTVGHNGHLYLLVREKKSWTQAKADCEAIGGYLACLTNKSEHRFIYRQFNVKNNAPIWLGGTDAHQEGDWVWLDGSEGHWPWNKNEPNNVKSKQHYASLNKSGTISDLDQYDKRVNAYLCEWDHVPTREMVYQTEESQKQESAEIQRLQAATLKHNELIVSERKRLQQAILQAEDESAITDAKAGYNTRIASIKQDYIQQLQGVLTGAIADDRLEIAGNIKTQILRVQGQLARLTKETTQPDVPALDEGGVETTPEQQPPSDDDNPSGQDQVDASSDDANDKDNFFGIPLE